MATRVQILSWMQEQNWYPKFVVNYNAFRGDDGIWERTKYLVDAGIIDDAFCWAETPEGRAFWSPLHCKMVEMFN